MKREQGISVRAAAAAFAVATLLAAGCGSSGDEGASSTSSERRADTLEESTGGADHLDAEQDMVAGSDAQPERDDADADASSPAPTSAAGSGAVGQAPATESVEEEAGEAFAADDSGVRADRGMFPGEPVPQEPPHDDDNRFENYGIRDFVETSVDVLSTFALDVDTGSYSVARQWLNAGSMPPVDSVRVEEYVNAFDYDYETPRDALGISIDGGPSPFDRDNFLVRVGVQSQRIDDDERPAASLTFVVDTSGSMEQDGRLELVKESLEELVDELAANDTVAIVEFDDNPSVVLGVTEARDSAEILRALEQLRPGGSTNVEAGLALGYDLAAEVFDEDRVNRVILLSDGVANAGLTDPDGLSEMIRRDADRGVQLLTIGVGMGNFNDVLMEQLADQGDGFYAYVDTEDEAERLFEDNLTATLVTLAIDAKIQVEFDPDTVAAYRLIGFENRGVLDSDFRNDEVDAGEIGAGHQVTAIYEVEPARGLDDRSSRADLGEVRLRWEEPGTGEVYEISQDMDYSSVEQQWSRTDESFRLAVVVAAFAEVLRDSPFADDVDLDDLEEEAEDLADALVDRDVDELVDLIRLADRYS